MSDQLIFYTRYKKNNCLSIIKPLFDKYIKPGAIVLLEGNLGAGKTFVVQQILNNYFLKTDVYSPTFSYVKRYDDLIPKVSHFDLYRLNSLEDFFAMGFEQDLNDFSRLCFIEWPQILLPWLESAKDGALKDRLFIFKIEHCFDELSDERSIYFSKKE